MNSERRHELQENILANYLVRINQAIEPYSRPIAVGLAALLVGGIGYAIYTSKAKEDRSQATFELMMQQAGSQDPEGLATVAVKYPGTPAAAWAHLYQGSTLLAQGTRTLYTNRMDAEDQLKGASKAFRNAITEGGNELLLSRAHFGIARSEEALGELDSAIAAYKECAKIGESEEMVKACEERIAALSNEDTKDFLVWFKDQDFSPADPSAPPSLPSGAILPEMPDLQLPDLGGASDKEPVDGLNLPEEGASEEMKEEPAKEEPAKEEPAKEEPAKEEPAKEEPAKEEPAKEEPAKEEPAKEEPAKEEPAKEEPAKEEPAKEEPAKEEPAKEEPAKEVPAKEEPAKEEPKPEVKKEATEPAEKKDVELAPPADPKPEVPETAEAATESDAS